MKAAYHKYTLKFKQPAGTSRGVLRTKKTYFLIIKQENKIGIGEANLFKGLSSDDKPDYEKKMQWLVHNIQLPKSDILEYLKDYSSLIFGWEQALKSLENKKPYLLYPSDFTNGTKNIPINGLIWMGSKKFMFEQIKNKIASGFKVIKLKIGAINFGDELDLLKYIRQQFTADEIEIRVDANGAFAPDTALEKLKRLSDFDLHSIEQPIRAGQIEKMTQLCQKTPIPIALDEELIGYNYHFDKQSFLAMIKPHYIILKPALHGGFSGTKSWIKAAENNHTGWWITSALESNIGLNAIAQFTYQLKVQMPQGLGTGGLFTNNFDSPLFIKQGHLNFDPNRSFNYKNLIASTDI